MKKLLKISMLTVMAASSLWLSSCKKDDGGDPDTNTTPTSGFTAKVDGADWTSANTGATYRNGVFVLSGKSSDGKSIVLRVEPMAGLEAIIPKYFMTYMSTDNVGIYMEGSADSLAFATNQFASVSPDDNWLSFSAFNTANKTVSGTFSIKVKRLLDGKIKTITGSFTNIVYDNTVPPTPGKSMTAKVNGTAWTAVSVFGLYANSSITVTANASNGTTIGLTIPASATTGQTLTPLLFGPPSAQYNPTPTTFKSADGGQIKITLHDKDAKVIKGTFNFIAVDVLGSDPSDNITEGTFVVTY